MSLQKLLFIFFTFLLVLPLGHANTVSHASATKQVWENPPVEKVKPVDKKKKKIKKRKARRAAAKLKLKKQNAPNDLGKGALTGWLIFGVFTIVLIILAAIIIGLGLAPWSVALYVLIGAEIAGFLTLILVTWVDKPGDPAIIQFIFALFGLVAINFIIGLSFLIWGLVISWMFGWIIGLILIGLAGIFIGIHLILSEIQAKK